MKKGKMICERTVFVVERDDKRSPVKVSIRLPNERTKLETKLAQVACIVETDMGLGVARKEVLGYDLMNALAQALIGVEVFITSLKASVKLELEDGTPFDRDVHLVFLGDVYREYLDSLESLPRSGGGGRPRKGQKPR